MCIIFFICKHLEMFQQRSAGKTGLAQLCSLYLNKVFIIIIIIINNKITIFSKVVSCRCIKQQLQVVQGLTLSDASAADGFFENMASKGGIAQKLLTFCNHVFNSAQLLYFHLKGVSNLITGHVFKVVCCTFNVCRKRSKQCEAASSCYLLVKHLKMVKGCCY